MIILLPIGDVKISKMTQFWGLVKITKYVLHLRYWEKTVPNDMFVDSTYKPL